MSKSPSRRKFLGTMGGATAATLAAGAIGLEPLLGMSEARAEIGPDNNNQRRNQAEKIRKDAAQAEKQVPVPDHPDNGDEARYPNRIGNYSKGLRHDPNTGEVDPNAYNAFIAALASGRFQDFENLQAYHGCTDPSRQRPFVNPQAAYAFDLEGTDSHQLAEQPAPAFSSAEEAGEIIELYWAALLRDVAFDDYATNTLAQQAAEDLSGLSDFRGPKANGRVTPQTLFRDSYPGCTTGPYLSQFLILPAEYGAQRVDQRVLTTRANLDYMTNFQDWLDVQNGCSPTLQNQYDPGLRFIRTGRDISTTCILICFIRLIRLR